MRSMTSTLVAAMMFFPPLGGPYGAAPYSYSLIRSITPRGKIPQGPAVPPPTATQRSAAIKSCGARPTSRWANRRRSPEPKRLARQRRTLDHGAQFCPRDLRMRPAAETAIGSGNEVLLAHQTRVALDALRHQFGMFHHIGRMGDDARNEDFAGRQLDLFPHRILMLVPRVGALDEKSLRPDLEHDVGDALEFEIIGVRAVPAAPAQMIAHAIFRDVAQRMIERLDPHLAPPAERIEPHGHADAIPQRRQPGIVDLQDKAGTGDRLVFDPHRLGDGEDILFVILVVAIAAVDFEARRRGRCQKDIVGPGSGDGDVDLLLQFGLADISDGPGAGLHGALLGDLRAGRIEQCAALAGILVKIGKILAILALLDERLAFRRLDVGKAAEALLHVTQPVAALGIFAFVDDIDADVALVRDDGGNVLGKMGFVAGRDPLVERQERKAADMRCQNLRDAALHCDYTASSLPAPAMI